MAVHVLVHALKLPYGSRQDDVAQLGGGLVDVPLEAPVELGGSHAAKTLVHVGVVVGVVVLEDDHLDVGQRRLVIGRADLMAERVFRNLAVPEVLLRGQDLGQAVVVEEHGHLVIARIALPISMRGHDAARRRQAGAGLAAASNGDVARHGLQQHCSCSGVVAQVALGARVEILQVNGLGGAVQAGELADGLGGNGADGSGPFGGLLNAVFAFAHAVSTPLFEAFFFNPLVNELVIVQILFVEHLSNGQHHGKVGARANGNPLVGKQLGRLRVAGIDDNRLAAIFVRKLHVVGSLTIPGHHRIHAPHNQKLRIEQVGSLETRQVVINALGAHGHVHTNVEHLARRMAGAGMLAPCAEAGVPPRSQRETVLLKARVLGMEDAVGAVLFLDLLHLVGDGVQRLFPANLHEIAFAGTFFAHALHGMKKARLGIELFFPGVAHGARARLHLTLPDVLPAAILAAAVLVDGIVGLDCNDFAVFHVATQNARGVPATICGARRVEDAIALVTLAAFFNQLLLVHQFTSLSDCLARCECASSHVAKI